MTDRLRFGVRTRLLFAVVVALTLALASAVAGFNLLLRQRLSTSATTLARAQAEAQLPSLRISNGRLTAPEAPDEGRIGVPIWVFSGAEALEAPNVDPILDQAASSLATGPERSVDVGARTRLYAVPVDSKGRRVGSVVAGVPLAPYRETAHTALVASLLLAALLLAAIAVVARWMLARALLPVSRMTDAAAAWSEHDLDRRFGLGEPHDELTQLASTLDALLERLAASLRREQRFTAELSHELRTPLARIAAETELALNQTRTDAEYRASLDAVRRSADQMGRTVEALLSAARQESEHTRTTSDAREAVRRAVASAREEADPRGVEILLSVPAQPLRVALEGEFLERIVQPLLDNAVRYGGSAVEVTLARDGTVICLDVRDDGAGVSEEELERIFMPGARGRAAARGPGGAGLGLALAQRLARSAGGEIHAQASGAGGRFTVRLPAA